MKTKLLTIVLLAFAGMAWGQENKISDEDKKKGEEVFTELKEVFKTYLDSYNKANEKLKSLKENLDGKSDSEVLVKIQQEFDKAKAYKDTLAVRQQLFQNYKGVYLDKGFAETDINNWYGYVNESFDKSKDTTTETKIISYFGKNETIDHDILINKTGKEAEIFKKVLSTTGEKNYFGDITIPMDGQVFCFYKKNDCKKCDNKCEKKKQKFTKEEAKKFKFKKLDVNIYDGYFNDIIAYVEDDYGNTHVFTNQVGVSILFYHHRGTRKYMYYKYSIKKNDIANNDYNDTSLDSLYIKLTDVMGYNYKIGNNYIPLNLALELPNEQLDNKNSNVTYQVKQETNLEKIVELRTYTDFLALFGDNENGLVQIEGRAKFYLFPYPFRFFGSKKTMGQIEFLPSISPYVNYSRFEKANRYISIEEGIFTQDNSGNFKFERGIELLKKRYLIMGMDGELFKWQHKNAPVKISIYGFANYNISEVNIGTEEQKNIKDIKFMGVGCGAHLSTRRFNNFGFDYKAELSWFDFKNFNNYDKISTDFNIPAFKNEAEIFYHPNGNPTSAIFTRLITYNYKGSTNNQAFYQFQFGYKFAIGNKTVNKQ